MTTTEQVTGPDPRSIFLTPVEVMARRRWGRTKGYARMAQPDFPPLLDGAYRLDTLLAFEDRELAAAGWVESPAVRVVAPVTPPATMPAKRKPGRPAKAA